VRENLVSNGAGTVRVACVEWPDGLTPAQPAWSEIKKSVDAARPDLLLTNELPFGPWIAASNAFSRESAEASIRAHQAGLAALIALQVPAVISTRPVWNGSKLTNEAFVLENGRTRALHRKQYFPAEPGWFETTWYEGDTSGFQIAQIAGIKIGVLICTEAMFNERARAYGRQGAALLLIPRATGRDAAPWKIAASMASLISGAYVASSNRVSKGSDVGFPGAPSFAHSAKGGGLDPNAPSVVPTQQPHFGGAAFAYAPEAKLIATTNAATPLITFDVDPRISAATQLEYPCYVRE
jgi:N-carbamoylputrescine amidase